MSRNSRMSLNLYPAQKHTGSSPLGFGAAPPRVRPGAKHTRQSQRGGGSCARSGVWRQGLRLRSRQRISPRCTKTPAAAPEEGRTCSSRPNVQARGTPGALHLPAPAGFPGRQVRVRRSAEDPEWIAQAVPRSPASADVPGVTARCSRPDFYPWNEYHEHILAVSPSYNLPCLQEEIPWPFHCRKVYIYIVDNFICGALKHSRQMKKWNEDSGSAGELCSVPEIFVANLSDFSSKSPSCGE